jgi:predicted permease
MSFFSRLRNAIHPKRLDAEVLDEMSDHLERRAAALREQGLSQGEAQREASRRFGNVTQLRERSRETRLSAILETTFQDLRYAWRGMRKSPAFAVTAILSLALAIGANTAIYSIVDAALLRPLPVPQPDRLFTLSTLQIQQQGQERPVEDVSFSYPLLQQFRAAAGDSARLGLFSTGLQSDVRIPDKDAPVEKAICQFVSGDAFDILQVPPALGRVFTPAEDRVPWGHPYIVISYDYWQSRFHGDPHVVGQRVWIAMNSFAASGGAQIIGVAQKGFFGVEPGKFVDVWIPAMMFSKFALTNLTWGWFQIMGRLAPGATRSQLQTRLTPIFKADDEELIRRFPMTPAPIQKQYRERPLLVHPGATGASNFQRDFSRPLWIVLAVGAGILLIACANIASLLLARSTARAAEMAMRISLGAGRARLIRQLLTESLMLSIIAGALGWLLAQVTAPALVAMLSEKTRPVRFALSHGFLRGDARVLLFCAAVSTLAAVFFGLLPAWQASGTKPMRELHGMRVEAGKLRLGRVFVGIQVAFAFVLIIAGASFLFTLRNLFKVETGFNPHNVAIVNISTELSDITQKPELNVFLDEIQRRVEALPGIQGVAMGYAGGMFEGSHSSTQVILPGQPLPDRQEYDMSASPRYFSTMRLPLLAGREFEQRDRDYHATGPRPTVEQWTSGQTKYFGNEDPAMGPRPVIVNQAFAHRYYGIESPIGKTFRTPGGMTDEIIGLVGDSPYGSLREGPQAILYYLVRGDSYVALYIRSPLDLGSIKEMVDREAQAIGHGTHVHDVTTLDTLIGYSLLREKLLAGIGGVFAFLGLLLAAIGLFGLLNYSVTRRTKEIGIRAALGARPPSLVFLVLKDLFSLIAGGLVVGLFASLALMTFVRSLLFGIRPLDPLVMTTAAAVFLAAAFIAGGLPASRAASIDPLVALRHE